MLRLVRALGFVSIFSCTLASAQNPVASRVLTDTIQPIARDQLFALAGAAARGELALVESNADGTMKQITLVVFVRAPADKVRALVADVAGYLRFVPNLKRADFAVDEHGQWVNTWRLELPISTFAGRDAYVIDPDPMGPIVFWSLETLAHYRWDFVPVEGGSLLVQAGYADVLHANSFVKRFVRRQPSLEHGLGLAAQYMLVSAVKKEAEKRYRTYGKVPAASSSAALEALSARGQVVVMRALPDGKLAEVSVLEHVYAQLRKVHDVIADPGAYAEFIAGVDRSQVTERNGDELTYDYEMSLPVLNWTSVFRMRVGEQVIDGAGVRGDLSGARYRWDLALRGERHTLVTYRANQPLARGSLLVKKLFEVDPSLEYGLNVAFAILPLRSIRGRAEGWTTK